MNTPTVAPDQPEATNLTIGERHEAVLRRWIDAYNARDEQREAGARAAGYIAHAPGEPAPLDFQAWTEMLAGYSTGFPDLHLTVEEVDGKVAEHWFQLDQVAVLQQVGLVIIPGPRLLIRILAHQLRRLGSRLSGRAG